jgi:lipopolysaccharide exporter
MSTPLAGRAGNALVWKTIQLGGSKGLFLVRTLILARLLSPDDFGLLAIATVAVGFMTTVTELGMTPALIQQQQVDEAHYDSAWTINLARTLVVSAALIIAADAIAALFAEPRAANILRLLALKPLIDAGASIKVVELVRHLDYRRRAFVNLPSVAVETVASVLLAAQFGVWALAMGALAGASTGLIVSYIVAPHRPRLVFGGRTLRPLIQYGRWVFLTGLVAASTSSLTQMIISRQLGAAELGLYFMAAKLAFMPHDVAAQVVGDVSFSLYARIQHDRVRIAKAFRTIFVGLSAVLVPLYLILISVAPRLVADVLGERWLGSEPLVQILAATGIVGLFGDITAPLFRGLGHPKWIVGILVGQSGLIIVLLWSLTGRYGATGAAWAWLVGVGASQAISFILARRLLGNPFRQLALPLTIVFLASGVGAATAIVLIKIVAGVWGLLFAVSAASVVTLLVLWFCDKRLDIGLRTDLSLAFPQLANLVGLVPATR